MFLKLAQRGHCIGKRRPCTDRFVQRVYLRETGLEMETFCKRSHHRLQHIPVALVRAVFRFGLKFPVEFENVGFEKTLTMAREHGPQSRQNPRLPINQSAVAVKADGGET